jgi:predicted Zn-dependent peptidase
VTAAPWFRRHAGAVLTYIATSPEREAEARSAMLEELERVGREPIGDIELERARNYAAGLVQVRRQRVAAWVGDILEAYVQNSLREVETLPARLRTVTPEEISAAALRIFRPDARAEYVVRGTALPATGSR